MKPTDDTIPKYSSQKLLDIKETLINRREFLKEELKTKHSLAYKWLVDHNIDLDNLQKYSKNIAAAITLTNQLVLGNPATVPAPTPPPKTDKDLPLPDSQGIPSVDQAKEVWQKYGGIIQKVAEKYDLDPQLIFATIMTESEGNTKAYRYEHHINDASYGLGQLLYTTAQGLGFTGSCEDMYRPEINIDLIGKYHRNTVDTYGLLTPEQMTVVYNTGKLFGYPHPGHIARFKDWYYNYQEEAEKVT